MSATHNAPSTPSYDIKTLRAAIPSHCFHRSTVLGVLHLSVNVLAIALTFLVFQRYVDTAYIPWPLARWILWVSYTVVQGLLGTGLWILAHECGHHAFSPYNTLNDTAGFFLHSVLLVPYFSFKFSHAQHHSFNHHLAKDVVFVPKTQQDIVAQLEDPEDSLTEALHETPLATVGQFIIMQTLGWPAYLLANASGQKAPDAAKTATDLIRNGCTNHFDVRSSLFKPRHAPFILLSDAGCLVVASVLHYVASKYGLANLFVWYFVPYLWVNHWVAAITYLQHTALDTPYYDEKTWTFTKGAAATIDNDLGWIGRHLFYRVTETHVLHHHFPKIAFYHAKEATAAIKPHMGTAYRKNEKTGLWMFLHTLWTTAMECLWVEEAKGSDGQLAGIYYYNDKRGKVFSSTS